MLKSLSSCWVDEIAGCDLVKGGGCTSAGGDTPSCGPGVPLCPAAMACTLNTFCCKHLLPMEIICFQEKVFVAMRTNDKAQHLHKRLACAALSPTAGCTESHKAHCFAACLSNLSSRIPHVPHQYVQNMLRKRHAGRGKLVGRAITAACTSFDICQPVPAVGLHAQDCPGLAALHQCLRSGAVLLWSASPEQRYWRLELSSPH